MAAPPKVSRFVLDDYRGLVPEVRKALEQLFLTLSPFALDVTDALSGKLTLAENLQCQVTTVRVTPPDDWAAVGSFSNGWVNFGGSTSPLAYRKGADGAVQVRGTVKSGTLNTTVFTLPAGYTPSATLTFPAVANNAFAQATVTSAGVVAQSAAGSNASFDMNFIFSASDRRAPVPGSPYPIIKTLPAFSGPPTGVQVLRCVEVGTRSSTARPIPAIAWEPSAERNVGGGATPAIRITNAVGLAPGVAHELTLLVWA